MKKYRFYYHYNKPNNKMTVHFKNKCYIVDDVVCCVWCETKWNNTQPKLVIRGFAQEIKFEDNKAYIQ